MTAQKVSLEKVTASITIPLPSGGNLKIDKNQKIKEGQLIIQRKASSQTKNYHLAKLIGVSPKKTVQFLVKKLGQKVKGGELVAQKKSFFGKSEKFVAPTGGVLDSLTEEGVLRIRREIPEKEVKAPFSGMVTDISSDSASLSFAATEIGGYWGKGSKAIGYLLIIEGEKHDLFSLDNSCQKQIITLQGELSKGLWYKAASLGAVGFVAGSLAEGLVKEIKGRDDSLPVVVFGENGKIIQEVWQELRKAAGQMVLIDGQQKRLLIPKQK